MTITTATAVSGPSMFRNVDELVSVAKDRASSDPVRLTVRDLIGYFDARARGARVVGHVSTRLRSEDLRTEPDFSVSPIDGTVSLVKAMPTEQKEPSDDYRDQFLRVHTLRSARQAVVSVKPQDSLVKARTMMALNDFSQLAVCATPRSEIRGISWESMGLAELSGDVSDARAASVPIDVVDLKDDLLPLLPRIASLGYVFVRAPDHSLGGIVTASDVSEEFGLLAGPFFMLGDIERRLRLAVERCVESARVVDAVNPASARDVESAENLSLGELKRVIESPEAWDQLAWPIEKSLFLGRLEEIKSIRNGLMHFSSDLPSDSDVSKLRGFLGLLRHMIDD